MPRWGYMLALAAAIAIVLAGIGSCLHPAPLAWPGYRSIAAETSTIQHEPFDLAGKTARMPGSIPMLELHGRGPGKMRDMTMDAHPVLVAAALFVSPRGVAVLRFGLAVVWTLGLVTLLLLVCLTQEGLWTRSNRR